MKTMTHVEAAEKALISTNFKYVSFSLNRGRFIASCYWPNGDLLRDKHCCGQGETLDAAVQSLLEKVEIAKTEVVKLKTAAQCKAAVIELIREHDAAPASFRDAVDALPVKDD